jgi:hypothetical protein
VLLLLISFLLKNSKNKESEPKHQRMLTSCSVNFETIIFRFSCSPSEGIHSYKPTNPGSLPVTVFTLSSYLLFIKTAVFPKY